MVRKKNVKKKKSKAIKKTQKTLASKAKPAEEKIEFEKLEEVPKPEIIKEPEKDQNTEKTLNMIYGVVALLIILGVIYLIFIANIGKNQVDAMKNNESTFNGTGKLGSLMVTVGSLPPIGAENAPITMILFSDYQCPASGLFYQNVETKIKKDYIKSGKAKLYFRDLPLSSLHDKAKLMALAARCANEQGKFWEMHDKIFEKSGEWSLLTLKSAMENSKQYATEIGLESQKFADCLATNKYETEINADFNYYAGKFGSPSTPTTFLLLPKDKTNFDIIKNLSNSYPSNIALAQNTKEYVVIVVGVVPYDVFKTMFDAVAA